MLSVFPSFTLELVSSVTSFVEHLLDDCLVKGTDPRGLGLVRFKWHAVGCLQCSCRSRCSEDPEGVSLVLANFRRRQTVNTSGFVGHV